jgi:hypothetical protein
LPECVPTNAGGGAGEKDKAPRTFFPQTRLRQNTETAPHCLLYPIAISAHFVLTYSVSFYFILKVLHCVDPN